MYGTTSAYYLKKYITGCSNDRAVDCRALLDQTFLSFRKNPKPIPICFFNISVKNLRSFK